MTNIHNHNTRRRLEAILESEKISKENKKDMEEFHTVMEEDNKGKARRERYLSSAKKILEYEENNFRLKEASKSQIMKIKDQIESSAYYHKEYRPETKKEYKKLLRVYCKWAEYGSTKKKIDVPQKAKSVNLNIDEDAKDRTDPNALPYPQDIKQVCQNLPLRLRACILTHWDLGTRINETLRTRVGDYNEKKDKNYIDVRVNPENSVDGSKSDTRRSRVKIAAPAIDRWLEEEHPNPNDDDAFLFCRKNRLKGEDKDSKKHSYKVLNYHHLNEKLNEIKEDLGLNSDPKTHTIRKARTTFFKSVLGVQESQVDKRIGHKVGSEVTRVYTRIDDSEVNNAYGEAYGEDNPEDNDVSDLIPLKCENSDCDVDTNPGYRDRCYECNSLLEVEEIEAIKEQDTLMDDVNELRTLVMETIEEEGLAEGMTEE